MNFKIKGKQVNKKEREYLNSLNMKWCKKCSQALPQEEFSKNQYKCKSCSKKATESWKEKNPEYHQAYRDNNKEKRAKYNAEWFKNNRDKANATKRKWRARQRENNPEFNIANSLRCRMHGTIIKGYKSKSTIELLGCSISECKHHLESLFQEKMSWDNYGEWHIDHIKPCSSFDLTDPEQQAECFHYTNLQPLWAVDNIKKGDFFED